MSDEPDFISQCGELFNDSDRIRWFRQRTKEVKSQGAVLCRYSVHEQIPGLVLFEAWKQRPEDQGDIRWQLVVATA